MRLLVSAFPCQGLAAVGLSDSLGDISVGQASGEWTCDCLRGNHLTAGTDAREHSARRADAQQGRTGLALKPHPEDAQYQQAGDQDGTCTLDISALVTATLKHGNHTIDRLRFSSDGRWLASSDRDSLSVWDVERGEQFSSLAGSHAIVELDETCMTVADDSGTSTWNVGATQQTSAIPDFTAYAWTPARGLLAGIAHDPGRKLQVRRPDGSLVLSVDVSTTALRDSGAPLEGALEGQPVPGAFGTVAPADTLSSHLPPEGLAMSPDGRRIAMVSGSQVFLFDGESGKIIRRLGTLTQRDVTAVSLSDQRLAFVTMGGTLALHNSSDGRIRFHQPIGAELRSVHLDSEGDAVATTCWDPTNTTLVFLMSDEANGVAPPLRTGEDDSSWCVRFSPAGDLLAVGDDNGRIRLFRLPLRAGSIMPSVHAVEDGLGWMSWAFSADRHLLVDDLAKTLRARFDAKLTPELRGWLGHYEYQALYHRQLMQEAWDVVMALGRPDCKLTPANEAFRYSMAVEIAFHLGRIEEIPGLADACIRIRQDLGDTRGVELCREMAARYLQKAGRQDLATRHGQGWVARVASAFRRLLPGRE